MVDSSKPMLSSKVEETAPLLNAAGMKFDPMIILTVITTLIGLFKNCGQTPAQAQASAASPGRWEAFLAHRVIRSHVHNADDREVVYEALVQVGHNATLLDFKKMYLEAA